MSRTPQSAQVPNDEDGCNTQVGGAQMMEALGVEQLDAHARTPAGARG
jgi:hypothetical protein